MNALRSFIAGALVALMLLVAVVFWTGLAGTFIYNRF